MHIYSFNDLKFTLKYQKRSYMFRSYDHPQGAYFVPCYSYSLKTLSDLHLKNGWEDLYIYIYKVSQQALYIHIYNVSQQLYIYIYKASQQLYIYIYTYKTVGKPYIYIIYKASQQFYIYINI